MCQNPHFALCPDALGDTLDHLGDIEDVFSGLDGLSRLSHEDTALLCRYMTLHAAGRNTVIRNEMDDSAHMLLLLTGKAVMLLADGGETRHLRPGMGVGDLGLLGGAAPAAACVTTEPSDFLVMTRDSFACLRFKHPDLSNRWLAALMLGTFGAGAAAIHR